MILLVGAAFSGSIPLFLLFVVICCVIGYCLSYFSARANKTYYWCYGLMYILLPLMAIYGSGEGSPVETAKMRLFWTGLLALIYGASWSGGVSGARKNLGKSF